MKALYARSRLFQWAVALFFLSSFVLLFAAATLGMAMLLELKVDAPAQMAIALTSHLIVFLPIWMLLSLCFLAPLFRLTGVLKYYSPYLIVTRSGRDHLELHGATPFDYFFLFHWRDRGHAAVRSILLWYIDGLISLAREIECGRFPIHTTISATSYIFNGNTARRYGFTIEEAPRFAFGGILTYPTQFLTYSFAKGRWALPPIFRAKKATIDGAKLCAQIVRLERVRQHLNDARISAQALERR